MEIKTKLRKVISGVSFNQKTLSKDN